MESIKDIWDTFEPKTKRYVVVGAAIVVFIFVIVMTGGGDKPERADPRSNEPLEVTNILTDSDPRALGMDALSSQVRRLSQENEQLRSSLKDFESDVERKQRLAVKNMAKDYNEAVKTVEQLREELTRLSALKKDMKVIQDRLAKQEAQLQATEQKVITSPPVAQPETTPAASQPAAQKQRSDAMQKTQQAITVFSGSPEDKSQSFSERTLGTQQGNPDARDGSGIRMISSATSPAPVTGVEEAPDEDVREMILPAGSILSGILINGMDAPTSINSKGDPYPTLIRVKREAVLPNYFRADVRECMLIGATHGSLSDERAYTRLESITCIFEDGDVVETAIDGYAVGEDGKLGMRGRVISKNGVILARALTAGFLEGISEAFTGARVPVISDNATAEQQIQSLVSDESLQSAGLEGAGKAMDRLADFYIELASGIYPVIEIDAGRQIEFVITRGTTLKDSRG